MERQGICFEDLQGTGMGAKGDGVSRGILAYSEYLIPLRGGVRLGLWMGVSPLSLGNLGVFSS